MASCRIASADAPWRSAPAWPSAGDRLHLTMARALRPTAAGAALGAGLGLAVARAVSATLQDAIGFAPPTFALATGFLAGTTLLAAYIPVGRALAVDPAQALRSE